MITSYPINIKLGRKNLHIWSAIACTETDKLNEYLKILSNDEQLKASRFKFEKDRAVYITARYLLRTLLGNYLNIAPKSIEFDYSEFGKPTYLENTIVDFNVSHSGNRIIIGFTKNHTIGIDIEKIKDNFDPIELAENVFSEQEIEALSQTQTSDRFQAFYRGWTRKESFVKAIGEGLSYPLKSFSVTIDDDHKANFIAINSKSETKLDWQLYSFVPAVGFIASISLSGKVNTIEFFDANDGLL